MMAPSAGIYKTSCKSGEGVEEMFTDIAKQLAMTNRSRIELQAIEVSARVLLLVPMPMIGHEVRMFPFSGDQLPSGFQSASSRPDQFRRRLLVLAEPLAWPWQRTR